MFTKKSATEPAVSLVRAKSFDGSLIAGKKPAPAGGSHTSHMHLSHSLAVYVSPK